MTEKHIEDSSAPLIEHLAELRTRLMWSLASFVVAILAVFPFAQPIFDFLAVPACSEFFERYGKCEFITIGPHNIFLMHVSVSIFAGFCIAFPVIAFQMWRFVAPGLYRAEQNALLPFLVASPLLFLAGASFAYWGAMPLAMDFFLNYEKQASAENTDLSLKVLPDAVIYLRLTMKFILAFGICFQLPVALTLLGKAGLVEAAGLARNRKYAVVGILVVAAIATPPDVFSQMILFAVIYSLYEGSILLVRMVERKREARLRAEGYYEDEDEDAADHATAEKGL